MKAVIIAGGEGQRLRPLTCNMPKALAPLCEKPIIEYAIELLKNHGFNEAFITLGYQGHKIVSHFDREEHKGVLLKFCFDKFPLGTAGSVKNCLNNEDVLVIGGDTFCDFDLTEAINYHKNTNSEATIIVKKAKNPREHTIVIQNESRKAIKFIEKPGYENCVTDLVNTGIYILSAKAMELIPKNEKVDFVKDLFPILAKNNISINTYEERGYWCSISDVESYIRCNRYLLSKSSGRVLSGHKTLDGVVIGYNSDCNGVKIIPPVFIGNNVKIAGGAIIHPETIIGDNVSIGRGSKINGSVIMSDVFIGENVSCNEAVVCKNSKLLSNCNVFEGAIIGEDAIIGENSTVECGVKIWNRKKLEKNVTALYDIKYGYAKGINIDEDGICGETNGFITPQIACNLGSSIATASRGTVCVGYKDNNSSKAIAMAIMSGITSAGCDVWDIGASVPVEVNFAVNEGGLSMGCYVDSCVTTRITMVAENGLPLTRAQERIIEDGLNHGLFHRSSYKNFGEIKISVSIKDLYERKLQGIIKGKLTGNRVVFKSADKRMSDIAEKVISPYNDLYGKEIVFNISPDGKNASAYSDETGYIFYEKLLLLCSEYFFLKGKDIALPFSYPAIIDGISHKYNRNVKRYYNCSVDESDKDARSLASSISFERDSLSLILYVLEYLREQNISLRNAVNSLPVFNTANRFVTVEKSPSAVLKKLCKECYGQNEGVIIDDEKSRVLIRPSKTGKGLMMFVESFSTEAASELCDTYEKIIKLDSNGF